MVTILFANDVYFFTMMLLHTRQVAFPFTFNLKIPKMYTSEITWINLTLKMASDIVGVHNVILHTRYHHC